MAQRIKTVSPYLLIIFLVILLIGFNIWTSRVNADDVSTQVEVGNSAPVIGEVSLNGKDNITLIEDSTVDIMVSASITDGNGCTDIRTGGGVKAIVYHHDDYDASCSLDYNNCYDEDIASCSYQSCAGNTATYECTASLAMQYYANPTEAGASFAADEWVVTVIASDSSWADVTSHSYNDDDESAVEVNELLALVASSSVDYQTISAGSDTGSSPIESGVRNSGNRGMDPLIANSSTLSYSSYEIAENYQEYSLSSGFSYGSGTDLDGTAIQLDTDTPARTDDGDPSEDQIFWGLGVPGGQAAGTYTGTVSYTATND